MALNAYDLGSWIYLGISGEIFTCYFRFPNFPSYDGGNQIYPEKLQKLQRENGSGRIAGVLFTY